MVRWERKRERKSLNRGKRVMGLGRPKLRPKLRPTNGPLRKKKDNMSGPIRMAQHKNVRIDRVLT